jgi:hypothetical protein
MKGCYNCKKSLSDVQVEEFGEDKKEKKAGNIVISGAKTGDLPPLFVLLLIRFIKNLRHHY